MSYRTTYVFADDVNAAEFHANVYGTLPSSAVYGNISNIDARNVDLTCETADALNTCDALAIDSIRRENANGSVTEFQAEHRFNHVVAFNNVHDFESFIDELGRTPTLKNVTLCGHTVHHQYDVPVSFFERDRIELVNLEHKHNAI